MKYNLNKQSSVPRETEHSLPNVGDFPPPDDFEPVSMHGDLLSAEVPCSSELEPKQGPTPSGVGPEPSHRVFNVQLTIEGIEVTQASQFYKSSRHLHAPHAELDNAVQLIKNKNLGIRVYPDVRIQLPPGYASITPRVYGVVWFKRLNTTDTWRKAIPLNA